MSMADNIRNKIKKKKDSGTSVEQILDVFNEATSKSVKLHLQKMLTGEIAIDSVSDLHRLFSIWKELNEIEGMIEGGGGQAALPEINMKQEKVFQDQIEDGKISTDEEGHLDVMDMDESEMTELIRQMDIAQNRINEGEF
ncbi:hypothetical protein 000TH008_205 [Bacillus phage 000TH008]|nr:hypothetical protein 000TH008_205 [Bacillus phage 000TH008]QQO40898.1 hypothetical protein 000TH009_205 [Bacillus phage 000TH009]QQO41427.1 hypothetical protein 015DV004_212 [Bacillus phage 015DV004]